MVYRLYTPADFPALYAIEETCFQPPFRFRRRYMQYLVQVPNATTWIAEKDGRMAGFAIVEWDREMGDEIAYLQTIEVAPEQRGRGIGGELLRRVEASTHTAGATVLWLHVDEQNAHAIRIYEAHGYMREGREEGYYAPDRPALVLVKYLGPGQANPPERGS